MTIPRLPTDNAGQMESIRERQADWARYRRRLEQEIRVLIVEAENGLREVLDDQLYRSHIPARSVSTAQQARELVGREHYALMVTAEVLPGMRGLALTRQLRVAHPDLDVLVSTWEPTVELLAQAFELRVLDVLVKPFDDPATIGAQLKRAVQRNVDRRMRIYVLNELRGVLEELDADSRLRTIAALDRRLAAFKDSLGSVERVLVVEEHAALRALSETLLFEGFGVETADHLDEALQRAAAADISLVVLCAELDEAGVVKLLAELRATDPHLELVVASTAPAADAALAALRGGVASYLPWPAADLRSVSMRARDIARRGRQARLMDNLFVELYRETSRALGADGAAREQDFAAFRQLIGLERLSSSLEDQQAEPMDPEQAAAIKRLDEELSGIIDDLEERERRARASSPVVPSEDAERRVHERVPDNQFVRFRRQSAKASTLAYLGDLSEGGVFIRTPDLLARGDVVEVDIDAEYEGQRYLVCCRGTVAWVARDGNASPMAPGFGVRFIDPPDDVRDLLARMVAARTRSTTLG